LALYANVEIPSNCSRLRLTETGVRVGWINSVPVLGRPSIGGEIRELV